jgi:Protein O-mannosyl-transferase TMEM260-like
MSVESNVTMIGTARHRLPIWLATGLVLGLFLARIIAEAMRVPWSPLALAALVVTAATALVWLACWLDGFGAPVPVVPALVLLAYVLWPQRDWSIALIVTAIAFLAWLLGASSRSTLHAPRSTLIDALTFAVAFIVYLVTLQKDILPADSGEFQVVTTTLRGILHQPGYPLYTLVGKLFTLLPISTPALRLNLMSVFLAAGTLTLVSATVRKMLGESWEAIWGGIVAMLALGTSTTFWAQATTANIRMPTAFFTAWCFYLLIAYRQSRHSPRVREISNTQYQMSKDRYLILFALAFSLGFGHYFPLAFLGIFFVVFLVLADPTLIRQPRRWWRPMVVFVLAQFVWLYLPIHAAIAPTPETRGLLSPGGFLWYALGQGFAGDMFAFAGPEQLPMRLALLPTLFTFQMNLGLLAAALVGAVLLMWRDWRAGVMLVGGFLAHTFIAITYRAPQTVEYEIPAYVALAIMLGYGVGQISNIQSQISKVVVAAVIVAGLANGTAHAPSYITLASDRSTREYVEPMLRDAPPGAIILSDWHYATPMWYLQQVEGLRNDVEVRYVFPVAGQEWSQVWRGLIEGNIVTRTVIVTHYWGSQYSTLPYIFEPFGQAWQVQSEPSFDVPRDLTPLSAEFDGKLRLAGYHLSLARASLGRLLDVTLALQSIGQLDRDYALTVRLVDANGARRTQQDRGYPTQTFAPGEVRVDRFTLPLEPTLPPGRYAIAVGVYYVPPEGGFRNLKTADGEWATIATFDLAPSSQPLPTLHPLDVPFAGGPTLAGVDYDLSNPSSLRVYLHWCGPGPAGIVARIGDAAVQLPELARGTTLVTGHDIPVASPVQVSLTGADGRRLTGAGGWGWPISSVQLSGFHSTDRYVLLGDQIALIGVESPRRTVVPGQPIDVTLRFLSLKPLVTGNKVSVRIEGENLRRMSSDDQPAANAIPTLKWIAGSIVEDRRQFKLPNDAKLGRVSGYMRIYDEFREDVLPPDDVFLGEWNVVR